MVRQHRAEPAQGGPHAKARSSRLSPHPRMRASPPRRTTLVERTAINRANGIFGVSPPVGRPTPAGTIRSCHRTLVPVERRVGIVTDEGAPRTLLGTPVGIGDPAPDFACVMQDPSTWALASVGLADTPPVVRVFSVVPSLDTSVCAIQTARFDAAVATRAPSVAAYAVSVDTPYAMERACRALSGTVQTLSDYRPERSFGHAWGVLAEETGELVRAVFVIDARGTVVHAEIVPDLADHPDYDAALAAIDRATGY